MKRRICSLLLMLALLCPLFGKAGAEENPAYEIMGKLGIGWNLGNSFDAPDGELAWGNPRAKAELFPAVKELGFDTIRIPVSWGHHVSPAPEYSIDQAYMARVDEVVHQALDAGLYVIIDAHHDNDLYTPTPENAEQGKTYLTAIWSQIAAHFADVDERLIFQTMNEPRVAGTSYEWGLSPAKKDHREILAVVNDLNQTALDAIRAAGGCNENRYVVVCPYAGKLTSAANAEFRMPQDSAENRLILSAHIYTPYNLCMNLDPALNTLGPRDLATVKYELSTLDKWFVQKGIPVVIDEMGCTDKDNEDARYEWAKGFKELADSFGLPCVVWDNGYLHGDGDNFGLIDRVNLNIFPESECIYNGLMGK